MENIIEPTKKERIEFIDAMRGFTMILVVVYHIYNTEQQYSSKLNEILHLVRMPLFFFISGYFSYAVYNKDLLYKRLKNRVLGQLIPTVIVGILYTLCIGNTISDMFFKELKLGYWFTIVLFEIFVFYAIISYFFDKLKLNVLNKTIMFVLLIILSHILNQYLFHSHFKESIFNICSLLLFSQYIQFFFFGIIFRIYNKNFNKLLKNNIFISFVLISFAVLCISVFGVRRLLDVQGYLGIIIVYSVFYKYSDFFSRKTYLGRTLSFIGTHTLEVYLLHYFILLGIKDIFSYPGVYFFEQNPLITNIYVLILSVIIVFISIGISKCIRISPLISNLMFGPKK